MEKAASPMPTNEADWRDKVTWYTHERASIRFIKFVGGLLFNFLADVECSGRENVPAEGGCIVATNHINNLDVIYMGLYLPRHAYFMAKVELYKNPLLAWGIRQAGSFPVYRGERDDWALRQAGRVLDAGQLLFMFPEGTRSGPQAQLRRGKVGVVKLALAHQVPVVPAAIIGTQNFRLGLKHNNKISIQIGRPLDVTELAGPPPHSYETLRELTAVLMKQIAAMLPPAHRGLYA